MSIDPRLVTAGGSQFQISILGETQSKPVELTITVTGAEAIGSTDIECTVTPAGNTKKIYAGTVLVVAPKTVNAQYLYVTDTTASGNPTVIKVEPIKKAITAATVIKTFAGIPLIGLDSANMQLQNQTNQAVLLSNDGWQVTDASTGSFQFDGKLMMPKQLEYAVGAYAISDALLEKTGIYVERFLPNGQYDAGVCVVTNASDTVSGAAYIEQNVTLQGSNKPVRLRLFEVAA